AFTALVARHESLRTTFEERDGRGVQVIHPAREVELPVLDLAHLPATEREAELRSGLDRDGRRPFDLRRGPLMRLRLIRLAPDEHVLSVIRPAIVTDGWSSGVLADEISALYTAIRRDEPADLPALPVQYADFAAWQRGQLSTERVTGQLDYWRKQLDE